MKYPRFLTDFGAVGFAAPSFGCNIDPYKTRLENALKRFSDWGHPVMLGPNCFLGEGVGISNTPELCGKELTDLYCSRENNIVLSCGGGELMNETIDCVDWDRIRDAEPKWYAGYSDNTNFTFLLTTLFDTASVYGPNSPSYGTEPMHPSLSDEYEFLCGRKLNFTNYDAYEGLEDSLTSAEYPLAPVNAVNPFSPVFYDESGEVTDSVRMTGRLLGGCLDVLNNLRGTKYDRVKEFCERYQEDGIIWFLESCELNPMAVRRSLWAMKQTGWFNHVKGFLIGRPMLLDRVDFNLNQEQAVVSALKEFGVPIAYGLDFGHLPPAMPMVCGAIADAEGRDKTFRIHYELR